MRNTSIEQIRKGLKSTYKNLQRNQNLAKHLFDFVVTKEKSVVFDERVECLLDASDDVLMGYLNEVQMWLPIGMDGLGNDDCVIPKKMFFQVYYVYLLHLMAEDMEWGFFELLIRLTSGLHDVTLRLKFIDDFQRLISSLDITYVISIKEELGNNPYAKITDLIQLDNEYFHLYEALLYLTQQPVPLINSIYESTYSMDSLTQMFIARFSEIGMESTKDLLKAVTFENIPSEEDTITMSIIKEPPPQCVYRRNLNPNPVVNINGDLSTIPQKMTIDVTLVRCDTLEEINDQIIGDTSIQVNAGNTYTFEKLRIKSTSRQLGDTHVCLRFELKVHENDSTSKVIDTQTSSAISVVSHTSLLKKRSKPPVIGELVPSQGPSIGNTRIAILGSGFTDTPLLRVKVGNTLVKPIFHGEKTLIITTPVHVSGPVEVHVSNGSDNWSTGKIFSYYEDHNYAAMSPHIYGNGLTTV